MDFGVMFFSSSSGEPGDNKYRLLLEAAKYADANNFCAVWTPERHFHEFGGIYPNPAITSAALSTITNNIQLRCGSLISPLHNSIRMVENFSVVDNLSEGRLGLAFGSGWNADDFVFYPERYEVRQQTMYEQIDFLRRMWRGEKLTATNPFGKEVDLNLFPAPISKEVPLWVTTSGNVDTYISAGALGANVLTHLIGQDLETLSERIEIYRAARAENGHDPETGIVSLMLHTFMGPDRNEVKQRVRTPFREYLRSGVKLEVKAAKAGGVISGGYRINEEGISDQDMEDLLDLTFERYFHTGALMGSPDDLVDLVKSFEAAGVNEAACLVDFLDGVDDILESLTYVNQLRQLTAGVGEEEMEDLEF